jgi:hypothetical protein
MSALINRVPTGRIVSLHTELRYLQWRFGRSPFSLQEMKLDSSLQKTQIDFFPLAVAHPTHGRYNGKYDPYLENPLDRSGFHLTQSVERDSQKSKSASECFTALEGLGWIERLEDGRGKITDLGQKVANLDYADDSLYRLLQESLLGYGPFVGFILQCIEKQHAGVVKRSDIVIGYPDTHETLLMPDGTRVPISAGSQSDSLTRTRSTLAAWAMTAGFIWPASEPLPKDKWHTAALELLKAKHWPWSKFRVMAPDDLFTREKKLRVTHPLSYRWMTKNTRALRERGQAAIRSATMSIETKIKNRRFAIVYALAVASDSQKALDLSLLIEHLKRYPELFVIDDADFARVMNSEIGIATSAGMVFSVSGINRLHPLVLCDVENLSGGAPDQLLSFLSKIVPDILV